MKIDFTDFYRRLNRVFWDFFEDKNRVRISFGGAGSGKSFHSFQEMIYKIIAEPGHNFLVCRKVANTNKTSTYALTLQVINELELSSLFKVNKSDMSITVKKTGYMIVFKGLDDIEKIKSFTFPHGILTDILIEEASEVSQSDFDQLNARLRGLKTGDQKNIPFQITMLLNPIIDTHWIKKEFIDKKTYQKSFPVTILKTTYLDNEFIDEDYKAVLEGYKEIDYEFYKVYCLGEWGSYSDLIFTNWTFAPCPYKEEDFDVIYNGMDFGDVHPHVISKIGFKDGVMYSYNELHAFGKTNKQVIDINREFDVLHEGEHVICDSAESSMIKEWVQFGYGAVSAKKGKDSITRGIDFIKSQHWIIDDAKCPRLAQEVQIYHRKEDKDGNKLEEPVKIMDDAIDAHRYALEPLSRMMGKPSTLSGSKSDQKKSLIEAKKEERKKKREILKAQRKAQREKARKKS